MTNPNQPDNCVLGRGFTNPIYILPTPRDINMTTETQKTAIKHHPAMEALKALFVENKLVIQDITENMILFPSRLAMTDHGLPKEEYLNMQYHYLNVGDLKCSLILCLGYME